MEALLKAGGDLGQLRLLARNDRAALSKRLKELGIIKLGHRVILERALLASPALPS